MTILMTTNMDTCINQTPAEKLYDAAKAAYLIHEHLTLDESVPADVGCMEAISTLLKRCEYDIPPKGIPGTATGYEWLCNNPLFKVAPFAVNSSYTKGSIIISPPPGKTGYPHGHIGIIGEYGILSNDSETGEFRENYTIQTWADFFGRLRGLPIYIFLPI